MSINFTAYLGIEAREIDPESIPWPPDSVVVFGTDNNNQVVARSAIVHLPHIEGTWIAETHRGGSLAARTVRAIEQVCQDSGRTHVFAFAYNNQPEVSNYLERFGYSPFPVTVWVKEF